MDKKTLFTGMIGGAIVSLLIVPLVSIGATLITTSQIADNAITTAKIATGAVRTSDIANGSISKYKITAGAVTTSRIADNAITTLKIANGNVRVGDLNAEDGELTVNLDALAASECTYIRIDVPGANVGDYPIVNPVTTEGGIGSDYNIVWTPFVFVKDSVDVNICNNNPLGPTNDFASQTWNALVIHQ